MESHFQSSPPETVISGFAGTSAFSESLPSRTIQIKPMPTAPPTDAVELPVEISGEWGRPLVLCITKKGLDLC